MQILLLRISWAPVRAPEAFGLANSPDSQKFEKYVSITRIVLSTPLNSLTLNNGQIDTQQILISLSFIMGKPHRPGLLVGI